ncbi:MAG: MarR family transcriptional regulator [Caldilineaceae bacterium]|nr:MarR family transcriptional regulator [Caldilineaceae bacterium]
MTHQVQALEDALVQLGEAWSQLSRYVASDFRAACSIPAAQSHLLYFLGASGPQRMSDIAAHMDVTLSGCTAMVDSAVAAGFVERSRDETDRRVVWIQLTEEGTQMLQQVRRLRASILAKYLSRLEPEEIQQMATLLGRVADATRPEVPQVDLAVERL